MNPVERLRAAATRLREVAGDATPGPWGAEYSKVSGHCVVDAKSTNCLDSVARATHFRDSADAAYIAMMHPPAALALADWLDETARWVPVMEEPLAVADAVLGGEQR